jgi:energy-coupling factor transport system permease protein
LSLIKSITIGQYLPGNSPIHRLDPRLKIIALILYIITIFYVRTFGGFGAAFLFTAFLLLLSRLPLRYIIRGLRPVLFLVVFTILLHFFLTKGGEVWVRLGPLTIESAGVRLGLFMSLRLLFLVVTTSLLTLTTSPIALTDGIEYLLKPFKRVGLPAHEIAMMMTIALRFIPTLMEESQKIMKAQMARGADFESGGLIKRARSMAPLLVPLFISAFRRADDLAVAMEARCYRGGEKRTRMKEMVVTVLDYYALTAVAAFLLLIVLTGL